MEGQLVLAILICSALLQLSYASTVVHSDSMRLSGPGEIGYYISWNITNDGIIEIELQADCICWMGIGFHPAGATDFGMTQADVITAIWFPNGTVGAFDRFAFTEKTPVGDIYLNCTDDVINGSYFGYQNNVTNTSLARFARKLNTGDKCDWAIENSAQNFIWAHGTPFSRGFGYHEDNNRGMFQMNAFGGSSGSSSGYEGPTKEVSIVIAISVFVFLVGVVNIAAAFYIRHRRQTLASGYSAIPTVPTDTEPFIKH